MKLDEQKKPIKVALIGCGRFGSMMIAQIKKAPGMVVSVACDIDEKRVSESISRGGYDKNNLISTNNIGKARNAIKDTKLVVTSNSDIAIESDVDVVVEATGNPEIGILHAYNAIEAQKHIVMVNVEADALAGPELKNGRQ